MILLPELAAKTPDKVAAIFPDTGAQFTFAELESASRRAAHWLISLGLRGGEHIAVLSENHPTLLHIAWAARRAGLYYTVINTHLNAAEVAHILDNSESKVLIASGQYAALAHTALAAAHNAIAYVTFDDDQRTPNAGNYDTAVAAFAAAGKLPARPIGRDMLYSSGTTGAPKGVRLPLVPAAERLGSETQITNMRAVFGFDASWIYLSPGPLYHAAPLRFCMMTLAAGGTVVAMRRFDARRALEYIATYGVTDSQWVPTMFVRLLDLPESERQRHDLSTLRTAIHAAAPCPPAIKERMIAWWGPIITEYYAGSEGAGTTHITSAEWLRHRGSVGRPLVGKLHIVGDDGRELPCGETGLICFSDVPEFEYFNDPEKTRQARRADGLSTYGDMGHVDADGYLYMSDRRADLILSGGVNIYPREIEEVLLLHPKVAEVVAIGVPDREFGEQVKAIVQVRDGVAADAALAAELMAYCRAHMSHIKVPKTVDFVAQLPRQENGKLPRRLLKQRYRGAAPA